jgi:hypothetical protein
MQALLHYFYTAESCIILNIIAGAYRYLDHVGTACAALPSINPLTQLLACIISRTASAKLNPNRSARLIEEALHEVFDRQTVHRCRGL